MNISVLSVLLSLGGKCLLSWTLVSLQSKHICKSFLGVFSVSLAIVDTALTFFVATLHIHADGHFLLLGLKLTEYNGCLLVQVLGQIYSSLQWPAVLLAGLDHFCIVSRRSQPARARWFVYLFGTIVLWFFTALYVDLLSGFTPVSEDVPHHQIHQCWVFHAPQILQIATLLLLTLGCVVLHACCSTGLLKNPPPSDQISPSHSRRSVVPQAVHIFLKTWAPCLVFLALLFLLPVGIPAYLGLNSAWLCFLNSLLIALVLCVVCPASQPAQGSAAVPPDSFCEWKFKFSSAAVDGP